MERKKSVLILSLILLSTLFLLSVFVAGETRAPPPYERFSYSIPGESNWTNTLTLLDVTDSVVFEGSAAIKYSRESPLVGPAGQGEADDEFPCPDLPAYSLVGKIGEKGACFLIGEYLAMVPDTDGFLYLAVNDKLHSDNSGKFSMEISITRPICGDGTCDIAEVGKCYDDCEWCGDEECNAEETCETCSEDCGYCEDDLDKIEEVVESYYRALEDSDFIVLTEITAGKLSDYHNEFKRFEREFQKEAELLGIDVKNELLPPAISVGIISIELDEIVDNKATVIARYDEKEDEVKLEKRLSKWLVEDIKGADEDWFTKDLNVDDLRNNHNEYLGKLGEGTGGEQEEIIISAETTKSPIKLIFFTIIAIVIFFGMIYFIIMAVKKRGSFPKMRMPKKLKMPSVRLKRKAKKVEALKKTKKCSKCGAGMHETEKYCTECGKKTK